MKKKASIIIFIFFFISLSFANTNDLLHLYDFNDCRWIPIEYLYVIGQNSSFATSGQSGKSQRSASSARWNKNAEML